MRRLIGLTLCATAALLSGCGGSPGTLVPNQSASAARAPSSALSWVAPQAQSSDLVYVSDNSGAVDIYSYPGLARVGTLKNFAGPAGLCSDSAGHVFVTNTIGEDIIEYAHGRKRPIRTLSDFGYYPDGCAVDPTTGNLAVASYSNVTEGPGSVAIYSGAQGSPTIYTDSAFALYFFCTYDDRGNLYVDGVNNGTTQMEFAVLRNGSSSFTNITLDRSIGYPGAIQWDGKYVAFEDTSNDVVYRLKIAGSKAFAVKSAHFKGQRGDLLAQFWIAGSSIFMPYGSFYRTIHSVGYWPYPAGGSPKKVVHVPDAAELYGVTFSTAQK